MQTEGTPWGQEQSRWPVTPYQVRVGFTPSATHQAFSVYLYIDGILVSSCGLNANYPTSTIKGFQQTVGTTNEFQFSFPRYPRSEMDRIEPARLPKLGTISVRFHPAFEPERKQVYSRPIVADFQQGNKKDAVSAGGNTFMSTTRAGDVISRSVNRQHRI